MCLVLVAVIGLGCTSTGGPPLGEPQSSLHESCHRGHRFGKKRDPGEIFNISLDQSNIIFVHDKNSTEDGIHAFIVKALNREKIIENAKLKGLLVNEEITVGGVKIILD